MDVGKGASSLPDGLPGSLGRGDAGYRALCSLVGLESRAAKQAFAGSQEVKSALKDPETKSKPHVAGSARRLPSTILAFYGSVKARSGAWRDAIARVGTPTDLKQPPSIEVRILSEYDRGLLTASVKEDALRACSDLFEPARAREIWHRPALAALPVIRRDVLDWQRHSEDRQRLLAWACFAVASVLDDVRLIEWAAGQVPELAADYDGLLASTPAPAEAKPTDSGTPRVDEPAIRACCEKLAAAVRKLLDSPLRTASMFDEVARTANAVEGLRRLVLDGQDVAERVSLIDALFRHIEAQPDVMEKLGDVALPLREHWLALYLGTSPPSMETLKGDVSRLADELAPRLEKWKEADVKIDILWESPLSERERRDPRRTEAIREQVARADQLWRDVQVLLSPTSHPFDFSIGSDGAAPANAPDSGHTTGDRDTEESDGGALPKSISATHSENQEEQSDDNTGDSMAAGVGKSSQEKQGRPLSAAGPATSEAPSVSTNAPETVTCALPATAASAFWNALACKEVGIAYHIARLARQSEEFCAPHALVAALVLSEHICSPEGELVEGYAAHLEKMGDIPYADAGVNDSLNLLVTAATLRPSLFAPHTGAVSLLGQIELSRPLKPIADAALQVSKRCARLQGIDIHRLQVSLDGGDFRRQADALVDTIKGSAKDAELHRERYAPAQRVWQYWVTSGLIHRLVQNVSDANVADVKQIVDLYLDEKQFNDHVVATSAEFPRGRRKDIDKRTVLSLRRSLDSLMRPAIAWLRLVNGRGTANKGFERGAIDDLKGDIEDLGARVSQAKEAETSKSAERSSLSVALCHVSDVAARLAAMLDRAHDVRWHEDVPAQAVLTRELLLVPSVVIDVDYRVVDEDGPALMRALRDEGRLATLQDAFRHRLEKRDIAGASLLCDWMAARGDHGEEDLRHELCVAVGSIREEAEGRVRQLVGDIEGAYAKGYIDTNEREDLRARVSGPLENSVRSVAAMAAACSEVELELTEGRDRSVAVVRREVRDLDRSPSKAERSAIETALEAGNVAGAREIVDRLGTEDGIPDRVERRDHLIDFLDAASDIETSFAESERPALNDIDQASRDGERVGGLLFPGPSESGPPSELLAPWYKLARKGAADGNLVKRIFENLGFVNVDVDVDGSDVIVATAPLGDRLQCPLHQYGSTARGKYRVLLNWRTPASNQLTQQATNELGSVIAFHFGHLRSERDSLRGWSLDRRRQLVVLDETLVLFLSTIGANRVRAFFDCTLPFTCAEPFVTTASLVPPELFYGRAKERQDIGDRYGSCFVYGGRQIGKTALLRSVEADLHRPAAGRIAKWIDLKRNAIGDAKPPEDAWMVIWRELNEIGVVPEKPPQGREALIQRLRECIQAWLQGDDRQILLLLDEADAFLEADSSRKDDHFRESTALKGIMDSTERRFKVVFCGLHNVLRTTARANHPLAHLGQPIGVGPLLSNGEWEEARNLVREPLEAIGCRFSAGEPVLYALAQTNYYPSLIQILGTELTRSVRDRGGPVPNDVTVDDIASVFSGPARDAIREKFQLTLQLDERYEVIAYSLAFRFGHEVRDYSQGIERAHLLDDVLQWWKDGFLALGSEADPMPLTEFEVLLDEMVELGVLRRLPVVGRQEPRYTLRNLNILPLLGNDEEIEQTLEKERARPSAFDPGTFRPRRQSDARRSLLTSEQETKLFRTGGVSIVTGNDAVNIGRAEEDLGYSMKLRDGRLKRIDAVDHVGFARQLTSARPGVHARDLYLVPAGSPWGTPWLKEAIEVLARVKRAERMSVVFIADPATLWRTMGDVDELEHVDWFEVGPWDISFLRRWCDDLSLAMDKFKVKSLMDVTGGWPIVIEKFDRSPAKPWEKRVGDLRKLIARDRGPLLRALGVKSIDVEMQLRQLVDYEGLKEADVGDLMEDENAIGVGQFTLEAIVHRLRWATRLRSITVTPKIRFNPLVKQILQSDV